MPINPNRYSYTKPVAYQLAKLLAQSTLMTGASLGALKSVPKGGRGPAKKPFSDTRRTRKASTTIANRWRKHKALKTTGDRRIRHKVSKLTRTVRGKRTKQRTAQIKRYPQKLTQIYSLCSASCFEDLTASNNSVPTGTIKNKDDIYSIPAGGSASAGFTNSSCVLLNIANTESHWYQGRSASSTGPGGVTVYRTGTQLCGQATGIPGVPNTTSTVTENDSFIWKTSANNSAITSVQSPFFQTGLAENAIDYVHQSQGSLSAPLYIVPNSTLDYLKINIGVFNPTINPLTFNIKVIRANTKESVETATFGDNSTKAANNLKIMLNSQKFTNPQQYSTLYSKTFNMPALRAGTKLKHFRIDKSLSLKYLRTQYRKKYNAEDMDTFGEQASSTFSYEPGFFNSVYIILSAVQQDEKYISNVSVNRYDNTIADTPAVPPFVNGQLIQGNLLGQEHLPQIALNINSGNSPGVDGRSAGLPPTCMGGRYIPEAVGPMFGIRGNSTVKVVHSVEAIRRSVPLITGQLVQTLQDQINDLTSQIGAMQTEYDEEHPDSPTNFVGEHSHHVPSEGWGANTNTTHSHPDYDSDHEHSDSS